MKKSLTTLALLAACFCAYADGDMPAAANPRAATRAGTPSPYSAPISVPSAAGQIETPRVAVPNISVNPTPQPSFTTSCDGGGCWGSDGTRYNAVGGSLVGPGGRICQSVGGVMQCP